MISKDRVALQKQIYNFLRTVTIKFEPLAQYVNEDLERRGYPVNLNDRGSWKYYLNMQGLYHAADTPMYVTSLDTRENILFSVENMLNHPRTRSVYSPGGLYYNRLCETYPEQVDLIKSILFPIDDLEKALDSNDLTLLQYSSGYLEEYEEPPLIGEINRFLEILYSRWYFKFLDDEPYFYITFWSSLWNHLAMLIMSSRESYIRTPYVHSWFIQNKLRSAGLDDYSDILDRSKSMMLYQNIDYLTANAGKQSNLVILGNTLLSGFGISLYGRKIVQESQTGADNYQLTPQLQAVRIPIDNSFVSAEISSVDVQTIQAEAFSKGLTKDISAERVATQERKLGDTKLNEFMTKIIEIRPITKSKVYSDTLNGFLLETLIVSIINDHYTLPVTINDKAVEISLYLKPKELLAIYNYALMKSIGITPEKIPNRFYIRKAFNLEIEQPAKTFIHKDEKIFVSSHINVDNFFNGVYYNTEIESPNDFSAMLERLWLKYMDHLLLDQKTKIEKRGLILKYLHDKCHENKFVTGSLVTGFTDYDDWLGPNGIDIESTILTQYEINSDSKKAWRNLADTIISTLVPITPVLDFFGNFTLSDYGYDRLQQLFIQMCSYRVVFLTSSRDTPDFSSNSKWDTDYGPIDYSSLKNILYSAVVRNSDITINEDSKTSDFGLCPEIINLSEVRDNYTVTSIVDPSYSTTSSRSIRSSSIEENIESSSFISHSDMPYTMMEVGSMLD